MSEAFRVQMTIGGDASGAKRAAAEATTAVKGLSVSTTDAATAAQAHVLALGAEAAVATRLTMAEAAVAAQITKASTEQRAALSAIVPLTAQAQAASLGLGSTLQAMTGAQAAVSGGTRVLGADMARLAGVDTQVRTATDAAVRALIDQSHAYDALRVELAPAITAEQRFAAVQAQVAAAVAAGLTTQREANVVIDQARAKYAALPAVMAGVEKGAFAAGGGTRMLGQQLSQVVQQGAVTGNYLGALAVQLPDMALGFGGLAIAASMVATVALPLLITAFGGGKTAAEAAADANDVYGESIGNVMADVSDATNLQDRYAAAVRSGSAETVAALKAEAGVRMALLEFDQNDLATSQNTAAAKQTEALAQLASAQQLLNERKSLSAIAVQVGNADEIDRTNAELSIQQSTYDGIFDRVKRIGLEFALNEAKIAGNKAAIIAASNALANMAAGVPPITSGLGAATGAAQTFSSALSVAMGYAASIQASINGISFSNIGKAAELAALQGGMDPARASNVGTVASAQAQFAPIFDAGENRSGQRMASNASAEIGSLGAGLERQTQIAEAIANWTKDHPTTATGGGGGAAQTDAIQAFIDSQTQELDLLRQTDPVQKEMIRNRALLAGATDAERAAIEQAISTRLDETAAIEGTKAAWDAMGSAAEQAFEDIILNGKSASDVVAGLGKMLAQATLQAALLGEGPLAGLMGTAAGGGLFGALEGVFQHKADGGMIRGPGTGTSDDIPIMASDGEFMVNARATAQHRGLLEAINSGDTMPVAPRGFAGGGIIMAAAPGSGDGWHRAAMGQSGSSQSGSSQSETGIAAGPAVVHNHFNITTPNPRAFAEDRIALARGAARITAQAERYR